MLDLEPQHARRFYSVIGLATILGAAVNLTGINPMTALYYAAVLNGIVAPPLLLMIMLISSNRQIIQNKTNGRASRKAFSGILTVTQRHS